MSTALYDVASSIEARTREVDILLAEATRVSESSAELYSALCRACCVLLASHLEGFLKDVTKSLILDFNYHRGSFEKMPLAMQNAFCQRIAYFEGVPEKEILERRRQLLSFFKKHSVPIEMDAFSYKDNNNKNPSLNVINSAFSKLGVPSIIGSISGGKFDSVFDNDIRADYNLRRDMRRFRSNLYNFPYRQLPCNYSFNYKKEGNFLWDTLVEEILTRRHKIAHGDTMESVSTHETLRADNTKLNVMMHGLMYSAASYLSKSK